MKYHWFYGLIISAILSIISIANAHAQPKEDDIWKQLPAAQPAYSKDRVEAPINPKKLDKSNIEVRSFDSVSIADYLSNDDFLYDRPKVSSETFVKRFRRWLRETLDDLFVGSDEDEWVDYVFYTIAAVIVGFVIARLLGLQPQLFIRKRRNVPDEFIVGNENIHAITFEDAIATAEARGDFRYATRLYYLQLLKHLSDKGMIRWEPQKTNTQYVSEMAKTPFSADFESLTRYFAYTWYGHFEVDVPTYQSFKMRQQALRQQTSNAQTAKA